MKKVTIAVAALLIAHSAQAFEQEVSMVEVEMTPMAQPAVKAKTDSRFDSYALESFGCCGLQQPGELAPVQRPVEVGVMKLHAPLPAVNRVDRGFVQAAKRKL